MPIYEYESLQPCARCGGRFEHRARLSDPELERCPECHAPVRRILSAPRVIGRGTDVLDPKHFAPRGFTQYRRAGDGVYEKTAGEGPRYIADDGRD